MRKVWYHQILIQTYLGFIVLILDSHLSDKRGGIWYHQILIQKCLGFIVSDLMTVPLKTEI